MSDFDRVKRLIDLGTTLLQAVSTAKKNNKSIQGSGFYAAKYHEIRNEIEKALNEIEAILGRYPAIPVSTAVELVGHGKLLLDVASSADKRRDAMREITRLISVQIAPAIESGGASTAPRIYHVISPTAYRPSRGYIEKVADQANGAYEHGWYDASAVMIRRFVETLIIEVYEHRGEASRIQDGAGNYRTLDEIVNVISADTNISLSRDTKRALPEIKRLGDRSAHNRRFTASKDDVDKIVGGLQVVAADFLHLAGFR